MALEYHREGKRQNRSSAHGALFITAGSRIGLFAGVAYPCLEIEQNPQDAYEYTSKGNLVAVISNGTAVLGLGDIGALAGKPVMEGKALLFKIFADLTVLTLR